MKKLNILIVSELNYISGATKYINSLSKFLKKGGLKVNSIEGFSKSEKIIRGKKNRIGAYFFKEKNIFFDFFRITLETYKAFNRFLNNSYQFSIIHYHHTASALGIILNKNSQNIPKIFHFHGPLFLEVKSAINPPKKHQVLGKIKRLLKYGLWIHLLKLFQKFCLEKSQLIIAPSHFSKKILEKEFKINTQKIKVVNNNADPSIFFPITYKNQIKEKFFLSAKNNILLIAGRLEPRKGITTAIQAMPFILKQIPNTILVISFPITENLENNFLNYYQTIKELEISKNIHFIINKNADELNLLYNLADLVILPSWQLENCPLTALEALITGTPVLGTPVGGIPEILKSIDKTLVVKNKTPEALSSGVINYFSLTTLQKKKIRKKCLLSARKKYNWLINIKKIVEIYKSLDLTN